MIVILDHSIGFQTNLPDEHREQNFWLQASGFRFKYSNFLIVAFLLLLVSEMPACGVHNRKQPQMLKLAQIK